MTVLVIRRLPGKKIEPASPGFHPWGFHGELVWAQLQCREDIEPTVVGFTEVPPARVGFDQRHHSLWHNGASLVLDGSLDVSSAGLRPAHGCSDYDAAGKRCCEPL